MKQFPQKFNSKDVIHCALFAQIKTMHATKNYTEIAERLNAEGWRMSSGGLVHNAHVSRFAIEAGHRTLVKNRRKRITKQKADSSLVSTLTDILSCNLEDGTKEKLIHLIVKG